MGINSFKPAKPSPWLLPLAQTLIKLDLERHNILHIDDEDLQIIKNLPADKGLILTPNHADETDPRLCLELSRRCGRRFIFMCNREAFGEWGGLAGRALQALGYFSVERGGHDSAAKKYSIDVVAAGQNVLVIFPEGEIFYLNESLQPFHSGAVDIGLQAIIEKRKKFPDWTAYLIPTAIKYRYKQSIKTILEKRIARMERTLKQDLGAYALQKRLSLIQAKLLAREEKAYRISPDANRLAKLTVRIQHARETILEQVEEKTAFTPSSQARTIDRAWQMSAHLREKLDHKLSPTEEKELRDQLAALSEVAQLASWQPQYVQSNPSQDRMAEMVLKLERELYRIKRPQQLAGRHASLHIAAPLDLGPYVEQYKREPHVVRHKIAEQLRDTIQTLINRESVRADEPLA